MNNIVLSITSTQETEDNSETAQFISEGKYRESSDKIELIYDESVTTGMDGITTTLTVHNGGCVTVERSGGLYGGLTIEAGKRHLCRYSTEYGDFTVGICGERVESKLDGCNGYIYLQYSVDINSGLLSRNKMEIQIREDETSCHPL